MRIFHNAKIFTLQNDHPTASAIAINEGKIAAVGRLDDLLPLAARTTELVDLEGSTVWPGLTDSHVHLQMYALGLKFVDCETTAARSVFSGSRTKYRNLLPEPGFKGMDGIKIIGLRFW